ncbi:Uncharacterised protein [Mycobacteroides abscessus subsp. abscessus]|nr:Uncharacterised protein [Mycobacteroides abscessus subsp. abscessus]
MPLSIPAAHRHPPASNPPLDGRLRHVLVEAGEYHVDELAHCRVAVVELAEVARQHVGHRMRGTALGAHDRAAVTRRHEGVPAPG